MAASITQTTVSPTGGAKLYTNTGTSDVIATLNMVSQTATSNPKMNAAYSSSSNLTLNSSSAASWSLPSAINSSSAPISLNQAVQTQGKNAFAVNITDNTVGRMRAADNPTSAAWSDDFSSAFLDPYYLISPTSWNSAFTTPVFAKFYSNTLDVWWDFNTALNGAESLNALFGSNPNYQDGSAANYGASYYNYGCGYDPYTLVGLSFGSTGYTTLRQFYWTTFGGGMSGSSGNRSSDSCVYNATSGSWNSWKPQQAQQPWATAVHADNGMFAIDTSGGGSLRFILLNLGKNFTAGTQTSSPSDYISSGKGVRIELTTGRTLRWLKYNPTTERWYIYIGGDDDSTGLYSWNDDTEYTTSTTGNNVHIESGSNFFTKETSFNFPDEKMTCPARISSTTWLSYTSAGVAYYSTDLITWTLATADLFHPTDYAMKNVGTDGIAYYGKKGSDSIVTVSSGFSAIDKAGWLEHQTEVGRYERTGIIIPKGQSIYLENLDSSASVSASLLTMDI